MVDGRPLRAGLAGAEAPEPDKLSRPDGGIPVAGLDEAIALASRCHAGQVDKFGKPYILHPLRVMLWLEEPKRRIAAVLHDTVEDSNLTIGEVRQQFGDEIAEAIDALTRREGEDYDAFIERCGANDIARGVKMSDLRDNMDVNRIPADATHDEILRFHSRNKRYARAKDRLVAISIYRQAATSPSTSSVLVHML